DDAVLALVAAAAVPGGHPSVGVAPTGARLRLDQGPLGRGLGDLRGVGPRLESAAGRRGLALADRHRQLPKISIVSPAASETTARFWFARRPQVPFRRLRLRLP